MARKSNKTAHVLNLLAGGSNTEVHEDQIKTEQPKKNTSNISLIDPAVTSDPLSSLIRDSLDKEIINKNSTEEHQEEPAAVIADNNNTAAEPVEEKDTVIPTAPEENIVVENPLSEQERIEQVLAHISEDMFTEAESTEEPAPVEIKPEDTPKPAIKGPELTEETNVNPAAGDTTSVAAANSEDKKVNDEVVSLPEEKVQIPPAPAQQQNAVPVDRPAKKETSATETVELDYQYINIMDIVVEERLMEFIKRFGVCTCDRCIKDTKALAMSNLPAKYIVSPVASVPPLLSFYKNKYNIYVITELTKACLAVLDNPRH